MASVNLDPEYFGHPKTKRLIGLLGRGAEVLPLKLWIYCGKYHSQDGKLTGYSAQEIEAELGWWGEPGKAVDALLKCGAHVGKAGYLETCPDGSFVCHQWEEWQGHISAAKAKAKFMAAARWGKLGKNDDAVSNAASITTSNAVCNASAVQCSAVHNKKNTARARVGPDSELYLPDQLKPHEAVIRQWLKYKSERGESYKQTGFHALLLKFENEIGPQNVPAAIRNAMSNNWAGVFPVGKAEQKKPTGPSKSDKAWAEVELKQNQKWAEEDRRKAELLARASQPAKLELQEGECFE